MRLFETTSLCLLAHSRNEASTHIFNSLERHQVYYHSSIHLFFQGNIHNGHYMPLVEKKVVKYEDQQVADTNQTVYMNGDKSEQLTTPIVDHGVKDEERKE